MGMPKTKADCDMEIARLKGDIAKLRAMIPMFKEKSSKDSTRVSIAQKQAQIAKLQAHKKTLR